MKDIHSTIEIGLQQREARERGQSIITRGVKWAGLGWV